MVTIDGGGHFIVKYSAESSNCHACLLFVIVQFVTQASDFYCVDSFFGKMQ